MCFSNIVGPVEEVGFSGHPLVFLAPSVYGQPHVSTYIFLTNQRSSFDLLAKDQEQ